MKRLQSLAALALLSVVLTACNREPAAPAVPATSTEAAPPTTPASNAAPFTATDRVDGAGATKVACAIDKVNAQLATSVKVNVQQGGDVRFTGWISDASRNVPAGFRIVLTGESTYAVEAKAGVSRPDVARVLKADGLAQSGFNTVANLGAVPAGEYAVGLTSDGAKGREVCPTRTRLVVVAAPR